MSLAAKIRKSFEDKWMMRFQTNHPDGDTFDGVVTAIKPEFIVLREVAGLSFDGVLVFPMGVLTGCRDGKFEHCFNRILRHVGEIRRARSPVWLNRCESLADVPKELQQRDIWPGAEIIYDDEDEGRQSAYYVGSVVSVEEDRFSVQSYDGVGKWEDVYEIDLDELFKITIEDSYTKQFNAYMREAGPDRPL